METRIRTAALLVWPCLLVLLLPVQAGQEATTNYSRALQKEVQAQIKAQKWGQEKEQLLQQVLELQGQLAWTKLQRRQYQTSLEQAQDRLEQLKKDNQTLTRLERDLSPYLEQGAQRLTALVEDDLGFLSTERQDRLEFIWKGLLSPDLGLDTKLKRLLTALEVEAGYATDLRLKKKWIQFQGNRLQARVLRLGRVAKYFLSLDGQSGGWCRPEDQAWQRLPGEFLPQLRRAMAIVGQDRPPELVRLPLPRPTKEADREERCGL